VVGEVLAIVIARLSARSAAQIPAWEAVGNHCRRASRSPARCGWRECAAEGSELDRGGVRWGSNETGRSVIDLGHLFSPPAQTLALCPATTRCKKKPRYSAGVPGLARWWLRVRFGTAAMYSNGIVWHHESAAVGYPVERFYHRLVFE